MPSEIPSPANVNEANLLLEAAVSNRKVHHIRKLLADQLIHRDMLQLQYNCMQVKKAELKLSAAELHVGHVRMVLRRHGYSPDRVGEL